MSGICAFFGHRDTYVTLALEEQVKETVIHLIEEGIWEYWCCEQGNFDWITRKILLELKPQYPEINLCYISAYNPDKFPKIKQDWLNKHFDMIYPIEVEEGHPKFAIERRNKYIVENADVIVCYVNTEYGGAYKAMKLALKYQKQVINLA